MKTCLTVLAAILFCLILFCPPGAVAQSRNILFLDGEPALSGSGWGRWGRDLRDFNNYDVWDLHYHGLLHNESHQPLLGMEGATSRLITEIDTFSNILGIGHSYGGLVLRNLANQTGQLTAMVLVGTPQRGARFLEWALLSSRGDTLSDAQWVIRAARSLRSNPVCGEACSPLETLEFRINYMNRPENKPMFAEMLPNSQVVQSLNQAAQLPDIPYAVITSEATGSYLNALAAHTGLFISSFFIKDCFVEKQQVPHTLARMELQRTAVDSERGFFQRLAGGVKDYIAAASPGGMLAAAQNYILSRAEEIKSWFSDRKTEDEALADALRCDIADRLLLAEWQLSIQDEEELSVQTKEVTVPFIAQEWHCSSEGAYENAGAFQSCISQAGPGLAFEHDILLMPPHDNILTRKEQMLEGADYVYHMEHTNHIQQSYPLHGVDGRHPIFPALQDLFDGNAGAAFAVPKQ